MGPIKRKGSFTRYFTKEPIENLSLDDLKEGVMAGVFAERQLGLDETNPGWALHGNEYSTDFDLLNTCIAGYAIFSLRVDSLRIDNTVLNMKINERVFEARKLSETGHISAKQKTEIKDEILEAMASEAHQTSKIFTVIIDKARSQVFFSGSSDRDIDTFHHLFQKSFGIGLAQANPPQLALRILGADKFERVMDDPDARFHDLEIEIHPEFEDALEGKLGSSFLTMLFYWASTTGQIDERGFSFLTEDPISLSGETLGAHTITLKKGIVHRCGELKSALVQGKRVSSVKVGFGEEGDSQEDVFSVVLDKVALNFKTFTLPKRMEPDQYGQTMKALESLSRLAEMVDELFVKFLETRYLNGNWEEVRKNAIRWIESI